jgi:hypothetical protein
VTQPRIARPELDQVEEELIALLREEIRSARAEQPRGRRVQLAVEVEVEAGRGCVPGRCRVARPWRVARGETTRQ